eukprot:g594.t1
MDLLEAAIRDDASDGALDSASAVDIMTRVAAGLDGMDFDSRSLATESNFGDVGGGRGGGGGGGGGRRHGSDGGHDRYYDDDEGSVASSSVMMPAHPTPYEVWQEKHEHEIEDQTPRVKVMSGAEMDRVIDRLNSAGKKKQEVLALQQHKQIAEEIKTASFKPEINSKSRLINRENHVQRLPDRQDALLAARDAQLKKQREIKVERELSEMREFPDHVRSSQKSWERIKRRQNIQVKERERGQDHLQRYGDDKKTRMLQRRQIAHDAEDREATFQPQINSNSLRIHQKMMQEGRDARRGRKNRVVVGGMGTAEDPGHEEEVFRPKINTRSRKVPVDGDAFSRLYDQAMKGRARLDQREQQLVDKHVRGVRGVGSTRKAGHRQQDLDASGAGGQGGMFSPRSNARFDGTLDALSGVLSADAGELAHASAGAHDPRGPVKTVEYADNMHFIFDLFAIRWPAPPAPPPPPQQEYAY